MQAVNFYVLLKMKWLWSGLRTAEHSVILEKGASTTVASILDGPGKGILSRTQLSTKIVQ